MIFSKSLLKCLLAIFLICLIAPDTASAMCGDITMDGKIDILDIVEMIRVRIIQHGYVPLEIGDCNGDGTFNILDLVGFVNYKFKCVGDCDYLLNCPDYDHADISGGCLEKAGDDGKGMVTLTASGSQLLVTHDDAFYNCCLEYFVDYTVFDGRIVGRELDHGDLCDCYCFFNLQSELNDIPAGTYQVDFYGIEGDLLASEDLTFQAEPTLIGQSVDGCLKDSGDESIVYNYTDGVLSLRHYGAIFNCSAELGILVTFEYQDNVLKFTEANLSADAVWCICQFDIFADVDGISPGTYIIELYQVEFDGMEPALYDSRVMTFE